MVVSEDVPGFQVSVTVDGVALAEYQDQHHQENKRTTTRYVEAKTGQEFAVAMRCLPDFEYKGDCLSASVYADGTFLTSAVMRWKEETREVHGVESGAPTVKRARFADVEIGELLHPSHMLTTPLTSS